LGFHDRLLKKSCGETRNAHSRLLHLLVSRRPLLHVPHHLAPASGNPSSLQSLPLRMRRSLRRLHDESVRGDRNCIESSTGARGRTGQLSVAELHSCHGRSHPREESSCDAIARMASRILEAYFLPPRRPEGRRKYSSGIWRRTGPHMCSLLWRRFVGRCTRI
jgi:hypothetical protein